MSALSFGGPWCFWGERPGFQQPAWAGRMLRKWKLVEVACVAGADLGYWEVCG